MRQILADSETKGWIDCGNPSTTAASKFDSRLVAGGPLSGCPPCAKMSFYRSKLVCLLLGILACQLNSLKVPFEKSNQYSAQFSGQYRKVTSQIDNEIPKLSSMTVSSSDLVGPFSAEYVNYLSFVEVFQLHLDAMYNKSLRIKCPFFRRRATDSVDSLASTVRFVLARHKSLPIPILPGNQHTLSTPTIKTHGLSLDTLSNIIQKDWKSSSNLSKLTSGKGYYITGKLTSEIYRDDCFFDGPDPDMPVSGLKKYISSTSQLFDHKASKADLISLEINEEKRVIKVHWRLEGILNLPWHPKLKPWTGQTSYFIDESGLVEKHDESWDITVIDAFVSTLFPFLNYGAPPAAPIER